MLKEQAKIINQSRRLLDIGLSVLSFCLAMLTTMPGNFTSIISSFVNNKEILLVLSLIIIIWSIIFDHLKLYVPIRTSTITSSLSGAVKAIFISIFILSVCILLLDIKSINKTTIIVFIIIELCIILTKQYLVYKIVTYYRKKGYNFRNILIIGSKKRATIICKIIRDKRETGYRILGCLDTDASNIGNIVAKGVEVIDTIDNLYSVLSKNVVDELIFAMPIQKIKNGDKYLAIAELMGIPTRIIPDWQLHYIIYRPEVASISFENFLGIPTMVLYTRDLYRSSLIIKFLFDFVVSGYLLIVLSPLFFLIALTIKTFSKGPILYTQQRVGLHGRKFKIYKFRTMVNNAEELQKNLQTLNEADGPVFKIKKDPRIIPFVGHILRRTGLDEIPQLLNIVRGEMSFIGPRPPLPSEVEKYKVWQKRKLSMKPGLTCIWQVKPKRNEITFDEWMKLDLEYIDNWSVLLDCKILLRTIRTIFSASGR